MKNTILVMFMLINSMMLNAQPVPRLADHIVNKNYDNVMKQYSFIIKSEEGRDIIKTIYIEAGLWIVLPEIKLGKLSYDAFKVARYYALAANLSSRAIRVFRIGGMRINLLEGGSRAGFVHILQRHAPMVSGLAGKGDRFIFGQPEYILRIMEKFSASNPKLINTWDTGKRILLSYTAKIEGHSYVMIVDRTNKSVHTFYPKGEVFKSSKLLLK